MLLRCGAMPVAHSVTFLGLEADAWTALGTWALVLVAAWAVLPARAQIREMRRSREEEMRPFVLVSFQQSRVSRKLLNLVIENVGRTAAHDVRFTFEPELARTNDEEYPLREWPPIRDGVAIMPPGWRREALFDFGPDRAAADLPSRSDVTVRLKDGRGREQSPQHYVLDVDQFEGVEYIEEQGAHHAAKALQGIERALKRASDWRGRLRVLTRDERAEDLDGDIEQFLTGDPSTEARTGPAWLRALARSPYIRGAVEAVPPLYRWIRQRLGYDL